MLHQYRSQELSHITVTFIIEMSVSTVNDTSTPPPISLVDLSEQGDHVGQYVHIFTASFSINIILGLPTKVYILWLILTGAGGTMASEFFSLNLTVSEILFCLFNTVSVADLYTQSDFVHKASHFSFGLVFSGRPLFQCCICVERYLAVVHPVVFLKYKPLRYRVGCCSVVWLMVLGSCCLCLFELFSPPFVYSLFVQTMIYVLLMSFCCLSVLWALKRPGPGDGDREGTNSIKMKAFKIILILLVYVVIPHLQVALMALTRSCIPYVEFVLGMSICFCICVISGFVQPLLYLHRVGKLPFIRGL
ncbi:G-protein coupled receptor 4-like [Oncorhynchus mykiss]|uniref:G-protein coupled receptor 4-like n=1 Tax=Oncorhynchus mykiss TaxID=8022 RepID=UPI00187801EB|nr:G-protein coupled receptor 4-like [Oncorhynchus mykiss]XP_036809705.1 G-protein coupled receptor 4-like [Oncorhynchus mykiss]